jgi:chromosome segregation ATPase
MDPQSEMRAGQEAINWLQDQVGQLRSQVGRMQQQGDQIHGAIVDINDKLRDAEGRLRELGAKTIGLPTMQEQLRQVSGLLDRIQDAEVLIDTKFDMLERTSNEERQREQAERNDVYKRIQELERRTEGLLERQGSVDEATRRFQEDLARVHIASQSAGQRLEGIETRLARTVEALTRVEQQQSEIEGAIRGLRREDDVLAERARLAHEVASRLEIELHSQQEEYRALPLLAERVELLRAERQRLEDRTSRVEESLEDARVRVERQEELGAQIDTRIKAHDGRIDHVHGATLEFRRTMNDQLLKLDQILERLTRRQVEEMERQIKELRTHANALKSADE